MTASLLKIDDLLLLTQCRLQELCFVGNEEEVRSRSHGGYLCGRFRLAFWRHLEKPPRLERPLVAAGFMIYASGG